MRAWAWSAVFILGWIVIALAAPGEEGRSAATVWNLATAFLCAGLIFGGWRAWASSSSPWPRWSSPSISTTTPDTCS